MNTHPDIIYKVTVTELEWEDFGAATTIYEQVVEALDIKAVIDAVNACPPKLVVQRRKTRSDKGKKRVVVEDEPVL